jgi:hypothetical protein
MIFNDLLGIEYTSQVILVRLEESAALRAKSDGDGNPTWPTWPGHTSGKHTKNMENHHF